MPHNESAKKRLRKADKRRLHNRTVVKDIKTAIKKLNAAVKDKKADEAETELRAVFKKLDKAGARGYLKKNNANRHKSRLAIRVHALKSSAGA